MIRLLSADFLRLKKNKVFWGGLILMAAWGIFMPVKMQMDASQMGYVFIIENGLFACAIGIGIILAVFCSLFIGTEYNDGTIRNKIIVGRKRQTVYLANAVLSSAVGIALCAAYLLPYLCIGLPLVGGFTAPPGGDWADGAYGTAPCSGFLFPFHLHRHGLPEQGRHGCNLHPAGLWLFDDRHGAEPDAGGAENARGLFLRAERGDFLCGGAQSQISGGDET